MRRILLIVSALLVVAAGCKSGDKEVVVAPPTTELEVAVTELTISHEAQRVEIEVTCNEEFEVQEEIFWLAVVDVREGDTKVVVLNVLANDLAEARSADVVITAGQERRTVTIMQSAKPEVSMEVAIGHRNQTLVSPKWGGEDVSGTIAWGDGADEQYTEGVAHNYTDNGSHTATFTMVGATSFEIEKIGAMDSLTIAVD